MSMQALLFLCLFTAVSADKAPVLIWSSEIPLGDLPQSHIGQTVKTDKFSADYLQPLTAKHNLVVFLQDKLTLEDFINHADVYNLNGEGGAFKNVKASLDEQFSVQLPAVSNPAGAIKSLIESFAGKVTKVDGPDKIASLSLNADEKNLILVQLPNILGKDEAEGFKQNDEMIGKCLHHLKKRDVKFSAVYTAESPSNAVEEVHVQRHLLAAADNSTNSTGKFFKTNQTMLYLKSINVTVIKLSQDNNKPNIPRSVNFAKEEITVRGVNVSSNSSDAEILTISLNNLYGEANISMTINTTLQGEYQSFNATLTFINKNDSTFSVYNFPMDMGIQATRKFCFHCTNLTAVSALKGFNNTNHTSALIYLGGFQIEPFTGNLTSERFSDNVWDCVEFFTTGIWMGIITTFVFLMILFFGVTMIANISTMDRFDDPKAKGITITVKE